MAILLPMYLRAKSSNSNQAKKRYSPERQLTRLASTTAPTTRPRPAKEKVGKEAPTIQVANIQEAPMTPPNRTSARSCRILAASAKAPNIDVNSGIAGPECDCPPSTRLPAATPPRGEKPRHNAVESP